MVNSYESIVERKPKNKRLSILLFCFAIPFLFLFGSTIILEIIGINILTKVNSIDAKTSSVITSCKYQSQSEGYKIEVKYEVDEVIYYIRNITIKEVFFNGESRAPKVNDKIWVHYNADDPNIAYLNMKSAKDDAVGYIIGGAVCAFVALCDFGGLCIIIWIIFFKKTDDII